MSDFLCPLCQTPTSYAKDEESFPFMNHHVITHAWACPTCHWTELLSCEDPKEPVPKPRIQGYTGEFRVRLAMFVQKCEENNFPTQAQEAIIKWSEQRKTVIAQERRIRKMVGIVGHKPKTDIDLRFEKLESNVKK